jgi:hypothetical protein
MFDRADAITDTTYTTKAAFAANMISMKSPFAFLDIIAAISALLVVPRPSNSLARCAYALFLDLHIAINCNFLDLISTNIYPSV